MSLLKAVSKPRLLKTMSTWPGSKSRLGIGFAVVVSFILHGVLIHSWVNNKELTVSMGQQQFSALIVAADKTTKESTHHPVAKKVKSQPLEPVKNLAAKEVTKTRQATSQESVASSEQTQQQSKNAVRGEIQSRLSQFLSYPEFARRKGWQGIVVVRLRLNESGKFGEIHVNSSSGFDILDNTALDALQKLSAIEMQQEFKLAVNSLLDIPIYFKLQGS